MENETIEIGGRVLSEFLDAWSLGISIFALFVSAVALYFSWRRVSISEEALKHQISIAQKSAQIQALTQFRASSRDFNYSDGIEIIEKLDFDDFKEYRAAVSDDDRRKIRSCVEHLNFAANLVESEIVEKQIVWNLYFMSYRLLSEKLEPWWFDGISAVHPNRFSAARFQARLVSKKTPEEIEAFDNDRRNRLEKKL